MRVGIETTVSAVTTSSSTFTVTSKIYTENQFTFSDGQSLNYSNCGSGSTSFTNNDGGSPVLRATKTCTHTYSTYGSSPGSLTFKATLSGAYNGITPSKSVTTTIPARPYAAPNTVASVAATRNSDTQVTVTWSQANETVQKPYTSFAVHKRTWTGNAWSAYVLVASPGASATSYVVTGLSANHKYQFIVYGKNSAGTSGAATTGEIAMTPGAPTNAAVALSGANFIVTWTVNTYTDAGVTHVLERDIAGGGYTTVSGAGALSSTTATFTDTFVGAGARTYRVRAVRTSPTALNSAYATSNTVNAIAIPLAPTLLSPNGTSFDVAAGLVLTWQHNPNGDGAIQTQFVVEVDNDPAFGSINHTSGTVTSGNSTYTIPASTLAAGVWYWRVRTKGAHATFSANSANATITGTNKPSVVLNTPVNGGNTNSVPLAATWTYTAGAGGGAQQAWELTLYDSDNATLLETLPGTGTGASGTFLTPVVNGHVYYVHLRVQSTDGLWSTTVTNSTTIVLLNPAETHIDPSYDPCTGTMILNVTSDAAVGGVTDQVSAVTIERRIGDDGDWVPFATNTFLYYSPYNEGFEAGAGGYAGNTEFGTWSVPTSVAQSGVQFDTGTKSLLTTWAASGSPVGQYMAGAVSGLTVGQVYTAVMRVYNPSATQVAPRIAFFGTGDLIPVLAGWQTVTITWTAMATTDYLGLLNTAPVSGHLTYLDKVYVYAGVVTDYNPTVTPDLNLLDTIPNVAGAENCYRVIAYSLNGTTSTSDEACACGTDDLKENLWVFLAYGDGFSNVLRFRGDPQISATASRDRGAQHFLGRRLPTALLGRQIDKVLSISGTLRWEVEPCLGSDCPPGDPCEFDSPRDEWEDAAWDAEIVCHRDYTGRRVFGTLGDVSTGDVLLLGDSATGAVGFSVTEVEFTERVGSLSGG